VDPAEGVKQISGFILGKQRDFEAAADLVEKGVSLDHILPTEQTGDTPAPRRTLLHEAVAAGDEEAIAWLGCPTFADGKKAGRGSNPNFPMDGGRSILHYCVHEGRMDLLSKVCDIYTTAQQPPQPGGAVSSFRTLDLNRKDDTGETPVQAAINLRRPEARDFAKCLLKAGAVHDFSARSFGGVPARTQTQQAAASGEVELLETLCDLGESPHQKDVEGNTLIHIAASHKQWAVVDYLISEKSMNINLRNVKGLTPLSHVIIHLAGSSGFLDCVQALIQRGAGLNTADALGTQPLHLALMADDIELATKLLEHGANIREPDGGRNAALHWAAQSPNTDLIQKICGVDEKKNGEPDVNQLNAQKRTPLHKACIWGRAGSVRVLLQQPGINQNIQDADGRTPLHAAAANGSLECAICLLDRNKEPTEEAADAKKKPPPKGKKDAAPVDEPKKTLIEVEDADGNTPLQVAMENEHTALVEALIAAGASVRRGSAKYGTLLHQAVAMRNEIIAAALVDGRAEVHARDARDCTPLHVAVEGGSVSIAEILLDRGADVEARDEFEGNTPLHIAARNADAECTKTLLDAGAGAAVRDTKCRTPFHVAAAGGAGEVAALLLAAGTDVHGADVMGRTALHYACEGGHRNLAEACLKHEADVNARDARGWTPLHVAVAAGACDCIEELLAAGAELGVSEQRDRTPLLIATETGQVEAAKLLAMRWRDLKQQRTQPRHA